MIKIKKEYNFLKTISILISIVFFYAATLYALPKLNSESSLRVDVGKKDTFERMNKTAETIFSEQVSFPVFELEIDSILNSIMAGFNEKTRKAIDARAKAQIEEGVARLRHNELVMMLLPMYDEIDRESRALTYLNRKETTDGISVNVRMVSVRPREYNHNFTVLVSGQDKTAFISEKPQFPVFELEIYSILNSIMAGFNEKTRKAIDARAKAQIEEGVARLRYNESIVILELPIYEGDKEILNNVHLVRKETADGVSVNVRMVSVASPDYNQEFAVSILSRIDTVLPIEKAVSIRVPVGEESVYSQAQENMDEQTPNAENRLAVFETNADYITDVIMRNFKSQTEGEIHFDSRTAIVKAVKGLRQKEWTADSGLFVYAEEWTGENRLFLSRREIHDGISVRVMITRGGLEKYDQEFIIPISTGLSVDQVVLTVQSAKNRAQEL
ncbi:MAG: hypothetical protein WC569_01690 [Candidatus Omnitrophota bacterium]